MVVLVRCSNGTHTLALESRLDWLIMTGLIVAYLKDGKWVPADVATPRSNTSMNGKKLISAVVSCF